MTPGLAPALLLDASWYGTLAAARNLGAHGVPVTLGCDQVVIPARWSRHVARAVRCPASNAPDALLAWLRAFGRQGPRHVLYPTSDDVAWLVARHREELAGLFELYTPSVEALEELLDKARLAAAARDAGLLVPETRTPTSEAEVESIARDATFPLMVKRRSQVLCSSRGKGGRVNRPEDLVPIWRRVRESAVHHRAVLERIPDLGDPMIQACHESAERVYTIDGFVDRQGRIASMACTKVLQRPRASGPGILFEESPLDAELEDGLRRMFVKVGFSGVFDAEFLDSPKGRLLIDVNPRFYNHMAFEADRGLELPWMAYLAAIGGERELEVAMGCARAAPGLTGRVYVHRTSTALMLTAQRMASSMSSGEASRWRFWIQAHRGQAVTDPARDARDRWPGWVDVAFQVLELVRHPRSAWRSLASPGEKRRR